MKKILIFSNSSSGHYPEYVHHFYMGIVARAELEGVFVVPESFKAKLKLFDWLECDRVIWGYIPDEELLWDVWYKRNLQYTRVLRNCVQKFHPDETLVIALELLMPYVAFMIPSYTKLSGILYEIYPYRWNSLSRIRRISAILWHWLYAKKKQFNHVFILNDRSAAKTFNRVYHTNHFCYLPDPFNPIEIKKKEDFREKYNLQGKKIILHFGSMGRKKGTLEILKTILAMSQKEASCYAFIFAGIIQPVIKDEFYRLYAQCNGKTDIFIFDQFCEYDFIGNWCMACDAILLPYLETYNSSGCIGYGAQFGKPVIAPRSGLLGKLVRKNRLGMVMEKVSENEIRKALFQIGRQHVSQRYLTTNSVDVFCQKILE